MLQPDFLRSENLKQALMSIGLFTADMYLIVSSACIDSEEYSQLDGCPLPAAADAVGIKQFFFSPCKNQSYATSSDIILISEFGFNFELEIPEKENPNSRSLPGQSFALSCIKTFTIRNISSITVMLMEPFADLPVGTVISFLLLTPEKQKVSELKTFENVSVYFGSKLSITPTNYSQLKTRTFLFLKNGTQKVFDSISPNLKTN